VNGRFVDSEVLIFLRVQASENNWCGPTPLCPYRHWLRSPRSDVYRAHDTQARTFVCTSSQQNDKKYPWPWFNQVRDFFQYFVSIYVTWQRFGVYSSSTWKPYYCGDGDLNYPLAATVFLRVKRAVPKMLI
jgi:hypothetical protein